MPFCFSILIDGLFCSFGLKSQGALKEQTFPRKSVITQNRSQNNKKGISTKMPTKKKRN
jgi:hypothetical protein